MNLHDVKAKFVCSLPGQSSLPTETLKRVSAAVDGDVREGHFVNQQVQTEPREGRGHGAVSCCHGDGLDAVLQPSGKVHCLQRHNLRF